MAVRLDILLFVEGRGRLECHQDALFLPLRTGTDPGIAYRLFVQFQQFLAGIGNAEAQLPVPPAFHVIEYHEMLLIPVENTGKRTLGNHLLQRDPSDRTGAELIQKKVRRLR